MVIGGGGFPYPGGKGVAEILTEDEWTAFPYLGVDRSFGVNIQATKKFDYVTNFLDYMESINKQARKVLFAAKALSYISSK